MIIKKIRVQNFRSILDETLECDSLTVLVGPNGAGKSAFLHALNFFYKSQAKFSEDDFYNKKTENPIRIKVTYEAFTSDELENLSDYVHPNPISNEPQLEVEKEISLFEGAPKIYCWVLKIKDFMPFWNADKKGASVETLKEIYQSIRTQPKYSDLADVKTKPKMTEELETWENEHPNERETVRYDVQFRGLRQVGIARLEDYTQIIFIPAVTDVSEEAVEGSKASPLTQLMDLAVRSALVERGQEIEELKENLMENYLNEIRPMVKDRLELLEDSLSLALQSYVPTSKVSLNWNDPSFNISPPVVEPKLDEDGFKSTIERCGHGLQRMFYLALIQQLTTTKANKPQTDGLQKEPLLNLIIAVEEPELYQHPVRQRHVSEKFLELSQQGIPGVVANVQLIYTTHSPLFVGIDRFFQIRRLTKIESRDENAPKLTTVKAVERDYFLSELERIYCEPAGKFKWEGVEARLKVIMTPQVNEGFFAEKVVVLVEGDEDKAAIEAIASLTNKDLDAQNIAVIPCGGKDNLYRITPIFKKLGIATYTIWDSDKNDNNKKSTTKGKIDSNTECNKRLLRCVGRPTEKEWNEEEWLNTCQADFACFKTNLTKTLRDEIGEEIYDSTLDEIKNKYGMERRQDAQKNKVVLSEVLKEIEEKYSVVPKGLINIVNAIFRLAQEPM